jgi:FixJ family two-component response regulator
MIVTSPRLLIVEDSEEEARKILTTLTRAGLASGHKLVFSPQAMGAALDNEWWDLVIAGNSRAEFGALDALWLAHERECDLPVVILSWDGREEAAAAALIAGATDYIAKGNMEHLIPVIERELTGSDLRAADPRGDTDSRPGPSSSLELLAGGVAHDFNNLLVAILGQCSIALQTIPTGSPARENLLNCIRDAEKASDLTQRMLAYTGYHSPPRLPTDLNQLIRDYLPLLESAAAGDMALRLDLAERLPEIVADPAQVQKALYNLVASIAGAVGRSMNELVISTRHQKAGKNGSASCTHFPHLAGCQRYVALELCEKQNGLNGRIVSRIFDPFLTATDSDGGSGLGSVLATVRGHRGGMVIGNRSRNGSLFKILFPAAGDENYQASPPVSAPQPRRKVVMVIDDEEPVRESVADILDLAGISVLAAANGQQGLQIYQDRKADIDLILLDYAMPGLDGQATLEALLKMDLQAPVLVTSGYSQAEIAGRLAGRGPIQFLPKPFSASKLSDAVEAAISRAARIPA